MSAILLGACATPAPADFSYSPASSEALIILVAPAASPTSEHIYRRVDMETKSFDEALAKFRIGGMGGTPLIDNDTREGLSLAVKEVPPGTYALVENNRPVFTGYASGSAWKCYDRNSAIYEVPQGQITVIVAEDPNVQLLVARKGGALSAYIDDARQDYPNLKGEIVIAKPQDWIMWPRKTGNLMETMNRHCAEPATFEIRPHAAPPAPLR